jgi:predicted ATPase/signal transduction histidine kinase
MIELSSYVFETLREDAEFTFSRGREEHGELANILLVAPASKRPAPGILERLEHEYSLRDELESDWAARPLILIRREGRPMLILEDPGGEPLDRLVGQPMELTRFLRLAVGLAAALGKVHQQGLIHKDIKPANLLVDSASGAVWLTRFGIASRLPRERQSAEPPEMIAGTLAYMAPEQTGRMNRSIDSRSDLYSLGVTFYQMVTGVLPFTASDPIEWVHCHIARQPVPPNQHAKEIPAPLSAIVMKLLAKTAEERYQTAAGVAQDLGRCLREWEARCDIDPFQLGAHDVTDRLLIPEKLYGREREIEALLASFDRVVVSGIPELVLVSGYSGIGKSSVVQELHKVLVPPRGLFASGKFDQYKRDIPYGTLAQAFQSLVRPLLSRSEGELGWWRGALSEALGPNAQLMVNLVPSLELVIGKQPPVPELPPQEAQNRFQMVFRRFLGVFARKEHPLALFLDDLQWLDRATLDLLEHLVTHSEVRHLLLIGAYRDNEVGLAHPLLRMLEAIRNAGAPVHEIVLIPLRLDDVGRLVADALHCEQEHARPMAELVQEKTGGNPFFAIQFFTALAEERLLAFDPVAAIWQWEINRIRAKSYTDNVVDLMAGKLKRFSATTQEALEKLACLGNAAEIATLTLVHGETEDVLHAALWEAVHAGLVFRQDSAYKFLHDRIQQAAYTLIPEEHRAEVHLGIGRVLLASMRSDGLAEHLLDVADQFNRGAARLVDRAEKAQVAAIDLSAGRKAKSSAAYASACVYFAAGMALLDERDWGGQYALMFSLRLERAECELLSGAFDTAERLVVELLERGTSKVNQAAAYQLKVLLHTVKSENRQAVASAVPCLRLLGIDIPAHPTWEQVQAEYETVWRNLDGRPIEHLIDLPLMTDPELQAAMQVLSVLLSPAHFTDVHLFCLHLCRMVNVTLRHGICDASAHGCAYLGFILGPAFHRYREGYRFGRLACDLVEKHGFVAYQAKACHSMGVVAVWTQSIATAIDFNLEAFRTAIETGDLTSACYSMDQSVTFFLLRNDPLDAVWRESEKSLDFVRKARFHDVAAVIVSQQRFIAAMQGRTTTFSTFSDAQFDEAAFEAQLTEDRTTTVCLYWILKLKARFLSGDYAEALATANKAKALLWASTAHVQLLDYFYYTALTVAALYEDATPDLQNRWRELMGAHREQLREWAENYPPTFGDKYSLVLAEIARLENRDLDAMRLYEEAIRAAGENGFVQNEGLANELAAGFYLKRGIKKVAHSYLREARYCYLRWGALGKVKQLDERYPAIEEQASVRPATTIGRSVEQLDVVTVMKASHAVAGEIVPEKLIQTLMRIALEHAGAQRGLLILPHGKEFRIVAEARTGGDGIEVLLQDELVTPLDLPDSLLHYVIRTQESVILDDASTQNLFAQDEYVRQRLPRSVLCLPLVKQVKLMGVLYLENSLAPRVFTPKRLAMLEMLASQAAISLDHARLYAERERFAQQRATELAKANEALRGCLDALASVPELDEFLGQVMAAITRQLGAVSSTLRMRNFEQNTLPLEFVFQDGRVMTPDEAKYPEAWQSVSLEQFDPDLLFHSPFTRTKDEQRVAACLNGPAAIIRILDPNSPMPDDHRSYLRDLGVRAVLIIPLTARAQVNGRLTFRFAEERDFHPEELEIARALATQASLAIYLTRLAKTARQSAVLKERNQLAGEIHDSLAQLFTGISMQLGVAKEVFKTGDGLSYVERAIELAQFGIAEARRSAFSLQPTTIEESGLIDALQNLVERSNVPGRLHCNFRSTGVPEESLPSRIQHELLRIAQEAISNAVRHAKPTVVSVTLRWEPPNLILKVKDNGSGISSASLQKSEGFGLRNMRTRVSQIDGVLTIQSAVGHGTSIVLTVPIPRL